MRIQRLLSIMLLLILTVILLTSCGHEHTYGAWSVKEEATCTEKGLKVRTCECGEKETKKIPVLDHEGGEWIIDIEATCTDKGSRHQLCAVCKETIATETIEVGGHKASSWIMDSEPSCQVPGSKRQICTVCDVTLKTETVECKSYTSTEIYDTYLESVGELVTYNKSGDDYSLGTCFVYTNDGKIITNYHVIKDSYSAKATINGTEYQVTQVLAYDKDIDIAVLKISASNMTPVRLCEHSHKVGEVVYALGSSQGLTATFSDGMITYSNREINGVSYTQHDAPISSGNSGGPLINQYGEVIGINTWTVRESQNLNFAINVSELNNLDYGTPMTMAEFYQMESDPFTKLQNYIIENGTYDSADNSYRLVCDVQYSSDYSTKYTRMAYYYVSDNVVTLDYLINDGECWTYIEIDEDVDGSYYWQYFDDHDYYMSGTLYASTFDDNTLLGYNSNNLPTTELRNSARELASAMVNLLCFTIDTDFAGAGVTAEDLHFYNY